MTPRQQALVQHAVVIGSGMAGLLSARILSYHFEQVTIIERDRLPDGPEFRPGVPQSRHVHGLLLRGRQILEQLFPGIAEELQAAGAEHVDWINDLEFHTVAGVLPRFPSPYQVLTCSRALLEWTVRQRVASSAMISFLPACEAIGLITDSQHTTVTGVRVRQRQPEAHEVGKEKEIQADLIVDASGRDSHMLKWLETLGYPRPEETIIDGALGYASRYYARPKEHQASWKILALLSSWPEIRRGG